MKNNMALLFSASCRSPADELMSIVNKLPLVSLRSALVGLGLLFATPSWAVDCDAIMNMVNVNVPVATVVATMQGSGRTYTPADVRCLQSRCSG